MGLLTILKSKLPMSQILPQSETYYTPRSLLFQHDCMEVMALYPNKYFKWAICDPPYGIGLGKMAFLTERETTTLQKNGTRLTPHRKSKRHLPKSWDNQAPSQEYYDEVCRVSENQIIFGINHFDWNGVGMGRIKWDKGVADGVSFKRYEFAYCSVITYEMEIQLLWSGFCQAKSLVEPMTQQGNKRLNEKRIHPCQKPLMLYQKLYQEFDIKGPVIDTHLGAGNNRIAAYQFNCEFVGCEIDEDYIKSHALHFRQYMSQLNLFN